MSHTSSPSILFTGVTGMLGSHLLARSLRLGMRCGVLVRRSKSQSAEQRVNAILSRFEDAWQSKLGRPIVIDSDLHRRTCGWSETQIRSMRGQWDAMVHCAANLRFAPATESKTNEPYRTNVGGTGHLLDLARQLAVNRLHHVSTAYVCGVRTGRVLETECRVGQSFANDYENSKAIAEEIVTDASSRGELESVTVYRPSIVIDSSGLAPVSGDRTIYGAYSMYQTLASRFGLPERGQWSRHLGLNGDERKNLIDAVWIAEAITTILAQPRFHGCTYHLTAQSGTSIDEIDGAFHAATTTWLNDRPRSNTFDKTNLARTSASVNRVHGSVISELGRVADPFLRTFAPYFRDDPIFDRTKIDEVIAATDLRPPTAIGLDELVHNLECGSCSVGADSVRARKEPQRGVRVTTDDSPSHDSPDPDDVVICGFQVRLPGHVNNTNDFEQLLFERRSAIGPMPDHRLDRDLYYDPRRQKLGKTYSNRGGCVDEEPLDAALVQRMHSMGQFDLAHQQFAQVAAAALVDTFGTHDLSKVPTVDSRRAGIFVGHSGGTRDGGALAMSTLANATMKIVEDTPSGATMTLDQCRRIQRTVAEQIQADRPDRMDGDGPSLNAYSAASLAAGLFGLGGRREVIDAACSSSLQAMQHAVTAMQMNRLDLAVVGGATFNNADNLILFSQSGACSDDDCYPFDERASGLISSEGYVAIVLVRRHIAEQAKLPIHAIVDGVGIASDGKGKGLWAPREEGQLLAMRRAVEPCPSRALFAESQRESQEPVGNDHRGRQVECDLDYLECHATSTQVGDATELRTLTQLVGTSSQRKLAIGSVKSNLGHLLEAAGLVGLVKCLIGMRRGQLPPSIHFDQPTQKVDWKTCPVRVVDRTEDWPVSNQRRAGVNAFGIGGLNAHATISQPQAKRRPRSVPTTEDRIAIVGRGVVLPGANSIEALADMLRNRSTVMGPPPVGRWPMSQRSLGDSDWLGVMTDGGQGDGEGLTPHAIGGYVRDFRFDAQAYRIPPKMVANANPAQFMLVDAVQQALSEFERENARQSAQAPDRSRIGVVVGTIFGGEFSHSLQVGLRLPELTQRLHRVAMDQGLSSSLADKLAGEFADEALKRYPSLMDETGGFTASTLASRLARTFDWMGGACAVDADEASGALALLTATEQLRAGHCDMMVCGVAQRSMDLVAFEQLYRRGELVESGKPDDLPSDGSRIFPGEGVAIMLLQRHADAIAQRRKVYGIVSDMSESWSDDVPAARQEAVMSTAAIEPMELIRITGHLAGAQSVVRAIAETVGHDDEAPSCVITDTAQDGYQIRFSVAKPDDQRRVNGSDVMTQVPTNRPDPVSRPATNSRVDRAGESARSTVHVIRLESHDAARIQTGLEQLAAGPPSLPPSDLPSLVSSFQVGTGTDLVQAAIVGHTPNDVAAAAKALLAGPMKTRKSAGLPKHAAWMRWPAAGDRVAWLFPGQGSQYAAIPDRIPSDPDSLACVERFDAALIAGGMAPIGDRLDDADDLLGRDVWFTQAWVLGVGVMFTDALRRRGHRPDVVLGHSFGECTAAWAAGSLTLDQSISFARWRSDAVVMAASAGTMLSVRGTPSCVASVLAKKESSATISHHNSINQCVVSGPTNEVREAKQSLSDAGLACHPISVPAAYHTPMMADAEAILRSRFGSSQMRSPRCAYLSAVSNRYLAEPSDLRDNLVSQLTKPVCFSGSVDRLLGDGGGLLIEVGPNDVLTRLARVNADASQSGAVCIALDVRGRDWRLQQTLIDLACEAFGSTTGRGISATPIRSESAVVGVETAKGTVNRQPVQVEAGANRAFDVIDVTRRRTRRDAITESPMPSRKVGLHEHATQTTASEATMLREMPSADHRDHDSDQTKSSTAARAFLFDLVVDLTGYDPEIIEFDADLEAELGVDSIKKAQLIGEMIQWSDQEVDIASLQLSQFASLQDIVELVDVAEAESEDSQTGDAANGGRDALRRLMLDLLIDQTGYDEAVIDMDADLEAELGVDSIKKAQLLGELEQQYALPSLRETTLTLADFPTLESIESFIWSKIQSASADEQDGIEEKKKNVSGRLRDDQALVGTDVSGTSNHDLTDQFDAETVVEPPLTASDKDANNRQAPPTGTHRFVLTPRSTPRRDGFARTPTFHGTAMILGDNPIADAIDRRWQRETGRPIKRIHEFDSLQQLDRHLDSLWQADFTPHLFITTPCDVGASWLTSASRDWNRRRRAALEIPFRLCQRWMQAAIDRGVMPNASLVSVTNNGGRFGLSIGQPGVDLTDTSAESGGLAGLTKAMLIESWMRGHRDTPMLVIDRDPNASADEVAEGIWYELANPSYDEETIVAGERRHALNAVYAPLPTTDTGSGNESANSITRGGNWIVAGGGRGITAMTAMALAQEHDLTLQLLGTAPQPDISSETRAAAEDDRMALRRRVMTQCQSRGENPVETWRDLEKAIEIDQTLRACQRWGIRATYHSVDVADAVAVAKVVDRIRRHDGPVRGVIQGAGAGQDARFDRKRHEKVEKCFRAKIDGCIALADATMNDPLEWFIGFGSISGRFGANGHTDYSAANDMLAKLIGRLRVERPSVQCVTFHWHAWGDVGMATKPEAKLALDLVGLDFMPADDGLRHFLSELRYGGDRSEVLITDRRYVRKFFPGVTIATTVERDHRATLPLLRQSDIEVQPRVTDPEADSFIVTLNPSVDLFLKDHRVAGKPTLPFVMAIEMMAEAARVGQLEDVTACVDVEAMAPIKCVGDDAFAVEILRGDVHSDGLVPCQLVMDLRRRDGRLVHARRPHFRASFETGRRNHSCKPDDWTWDDSLAMDGVEYLDPDAPVYHGDSLQCLRRIGYDDAQQTAQGIIVAPSPAHLAGEHRPLVGWSIPCAAMDAVLYAAGCLAHRVGQRFDMGDRVSLPVRFGRIDLGRLPDPGEPLRVTVQFQGRPTVEGGLLTATLLGRNDDRILSLRDYRIGWVG
ncbi:MAG: SDR family NAD(P)-dependent oxidoreductase [Planctomycetota bacterium]